MSRQSDEPLIHGICRQLDSAAQSIDAATRSRLNLARQQALRQGRPRAHSGWAWGGGLATAGATVLAFTLWYQNPEAGLAPDPMIEDIDILAAEEDLELIEELEFYHWLQQRGEGPV